MKTFAIFTTTRGDLATLSPLIKCIKKNKKIKCLFFVGGTHLKKNYGSTLLEIKKEILKITDYFNYYIRNSNPSSLLDSLADAHIKVKKIFNKYKFDGVIIMGDRYEKLSIVNNAIIFKKLIIHICGGEKSEGVIDEQVRHMMTKSSHIHFVMCEEYKKNILAMGEQRNRVKNVGHLAIDNLRGFKALNKKKLFKELNLDIKKKIGILTYHPVTLKTEISSLRQIKNIINSIKKTNLQIIVTKPGHDENADIITRFILKELKKNKNLIYIESLGFKKLFSLYKYSDLVIGNSSSGITEAPYFGIPTINIGERQQGRFMHKNIINTNYDVKSIKSAIALALSNKFKNQIRKMKLHFGNGRAAIKIVSYLQKLKINKNLLWKKLVKN